MTKKRFRTGKGILEEGYFSETIIDNETGKAYYKGYANYKSAKEMCELLNKLIEENEQLKARIERLERKIQRERNVHVKEHEKWEDEILTENEKIKQQRDFYYARLQKIIKIANGDLND